MHESGAQKIHEESVTGEITFLEGVASWVTGRTRPGSLSLSHSLTRSLSHCLPVALSISLSLSPSLTRTLSHLHAGPTRPRGAERRRTRQREGERERDRARERERERERERASEAERDERLSFKWTFVYQDHTM